MAELLLAHTGLIDPGHLDEARRMVEDAFDGDFDAADWDHALGGLHALVREDGELVAHGALVGRRVLHGGRALRAGYVEGVAVRADARRRGHASTVMAALEDAARRAFEVAALAASDEGMALYRSRGWRVWRGPLSVLSPVGTVRTPEDEGGVLVLPATAPLDLDGELVCDWRPGDVW
jgi:aminoglycoside 2'-N-acetyltransferase I